MNPAATHEPGTAVRQGSALRSEFDALISGCGICVLEDAHISLAGRDRVRWLNGMITNNVRDLQPGHGVYAFVLNPQGHIQADLYAFEQGERFLVETERPQLETLMALFRRYIIMDQVELEDWSEKFTTISVVGAKARDILARISWNTELAPLELAQLSWNAGEVTVVHGDNASVPSYKILVRQEQVDSIWQALERAGGSRVHGDALEALRVVSGVPKFGQDIRNRYLPQETGQQRALNFHKGCYIGQEIVERIRSRGAVHRTFIGFDIEGAGPTAGTKILSDDKEVGEITSIVSIPTTAGERTIAVGYLRKEFAAGDKELTAATSRVKPRRLPFSEFLVAH
jgi:folate-binding protein YgfZ